MPDACGQLYAKAGRDAVVYFVIEGFSVLRIHVV